MTTRNQRLEAVARAIDKARDRWCESSGNRSSMSSLNDALAQAALSTIEPELEAMREVLSVIDLEVTQAPDVASQMHRKYVNAQIRSETLRQVGAALNKEGEWSDEKAKASSLKSHARWFDQDTKDTTDE